MRFVVLACLATILSPGCAVHGMQMTFATAHAGGSRHVVPAHHGLFGRWSRFTPHGNHAFFVLGRDGRWKSGRRTRHGFHVDQHGRWIVRHGVLHLDHGTGFRPFARFHVSSGALRLTTASGHRQVWHRF